MHNDEYLMVFIVDQNLPGINALVMAVLFSLHLGKEYT